MNDEAEDSMEYAVRLALCSVQRFLMSAQSEGSDCCQVGGGVTPDVQGRGKGGGHGFPHPTIAGSE